MKTEQVWKLGILSLTLTTPPLLAADETPKPVERISVTGSRIPRATQEGPTSVTVITGKDLEDQGYKNVFDALNQQTQNTGFTQGADFGNTFTPAANTISLRGLGPNHTLVLINGRRVAEYPIAYEGNVNFVNLANIPSALIDRVEILNGSGAAIYGSDAIAGVVNIILKKRASGVDVNLKVGGTQRGGGSNGRVQVTGGANVGALRALFGMELSKTNAIWSKDRPFMAANNMNGEKLTPIWSRQNLANKRFIGPSDGCGALAGLFNNTVEAVSSRTGTTCGTGLARPTYWTTQTRNQSQNFYAGLNYDLSDDTTLFADAYFGLNNTQNNTRGPSWSSAADKGGYFLNQLTNRYEVWKRSFAPEEIGGVQRYNREWDDQAANLAFGVKGRLGKSSWQYEAAYNASAYTSYASSPSIKNRIDEFFLGPQLGTDVDGIAIYAPDASRFEQPLTPQAFASLYAHTVSKNNAWTQNLSFSAYGEIIELPAGPLSAASVVEWGNQGYSNRPDKRINEQQFYNRSTVVDVGGTRSRYALASELSIPIIKSLKTTLAGRYDHYDFADHADNKFTYSAGLEFRPLDTLLFRSNYATSFRAPDMNYIYQSETKGYYSSSTDYYRCRLAGQPLATCDYAQTSPGANYTQSGNKNLKSENGKSFGFGLVWSPVSSFDITADYWQIRIDDLVTSLDGDRILRDEADCRTGVLPIDSALCTDAINRVRRNPSTAIQGPDEIIAVLINPINAASEKTSGYDLSATVRWKLDQLGRWSWKTQYSKVLSHKYKQFANDEEQDRLKSLDNSDWPDKLITNLSWSLKDWSATLQFTRYGRIPNGDQTTRLTPTTLTNLSTRYQFSKQGSLSLIVNNLFNQIKIDNTGGWPYYPVGSYSSHGRTAWLELGYHFN
ncbi:outer membrane receptor protein involved in Fe transport [Chitinivorax tropicus]|uniref:Outer membrane receptor protein involved in Fe transport n=1 Tax=Chitinivorax tropicus TaxID=714531 RepID=A0A840MNZ0_9PROT|nr:TonB-dependent receptor [Chitinivorax tropicus]MBB5018717.1 outer membrane receptor protein involved in Fe transport [Chitinivorax tropicus]